MTTQTLAPVAETRRRLRVAHSAGYVLTGFPIAVLAFVLLVTGVSLGLGTLVITIGLGVLAVTLGIAKAFAGLERVRLDALLGRRVPRPPYREPRGGVIGRALSAGADPRRWLDLAHGLVGFPIAVASFVVTVAWFGAAVSGLSYVLWEWSLPRGADDQTLAELIGLGDGRAADILLTTGLGAVAALTLPWVVRGCAAVQAGVAWALLCGYPED
ncbi:MAG TPA: sensor domain-containing protein [Mycobacteriales bacterium]|nr:sensor domain-containing protein [Mycobacteriales bacterium]